MTRLGILIVLLTSTLPGLGQFLNKDVGPATCLKTTWTEKNEGIGLKVPLVVKYWKPNDKPTILGRITAFRARFLRKTLDGLSTMRTSGDPVMIESTGGLNIKQKVYPPNVPQTVDVDAFINFVPSDVQYENSKQILIVSFEVTNTLRDGSVEGNWLDPVTVEIPKACSLFSRLRKN